MAANPQQISIMMPDSGEARPINAPTKATIPKILKDVFVF